MTKAWTSNHLSRRSFGKLAGAAGLAFRLATTPAPDVLAGRSR